MPKPTYETWFMEGKLIPNVHYVEIKPDYSDLKQKMDYYIAHPDEAQKIIDNAHAYVEQFKNKRRERIISLLVMEKYLTCING
jgi:spore maturation protein CgeB